MTAALSAVRGVRRVRVIFRPGPRRVSVQPVVSPRKVLKVRGLTAGLTAAYRRLNFMLKLNLALTAAAAREFIRPARRLCAGRPPSGARRPRVCPHSAALVREHQTVTAPTAPTAGSAT